MSNLRCPFRQPLRVAWHGFAGGREMAEDRDRRRGPPRHGDSFTTPASNSSCRSPQRVERYLGRPTHAIVYPTNLLVVNNRGLKASRAKPTHINSADGA